VGGVRRLDVQYGGGSDRGKWAHELLSTAGSAFLALALGGGLLGVWRWWDFRNRTQWIL
jgi:hypothetical protein